MLSEIEPLLDNEHKILKDVLCSLSNEKTKNKNLSYRITGNLDKLIKIYINDFRHQYSIIYLILTTIDKESNLSIDYLMENFQTSHNMVKENKDNKYSEDFKNKFFKLYDHVILEILQIKYIREIEDRGNNDKNTLLKVVNDIKSKKEQALQESNEALSKVEEVNKRLENSQKEYITILGIFASIIISFVAGLSFSTSVLSNIDKVSIYRLTFIICLIGLFITNILYYLFAFLDKIHQGKNHQHTNKSIIIFNSIMIILMISIFIYWKFFN